jgi:signal peptidase II
LPDANTDESAPPSPGLLRLAPTAALRSGGAVVLFVAVASAGLAGDLWSKHAVFDELLPAAYVGDPRAIAHGRRIKEHLESLPAYADMSPARRGPEVTSGVLRSLNRTRQVMPGLCFTLSTNPGVVFGIDVPRVAVWAATALTTLLVVCFFATSEAKARWLHVALGMILAGAVGNLYDRLVATVAVPGLDEPIRHQVRDFIDGSQIAIGGINYPYIFNIADVLLVVGVGILMVHWYLAGRKVTSGGEQGDRSAAGRRGK